jgi:hypothetical protein
MTRRQLQRYKNVEQDGRRGGLGMFLELICHSRGNGEKYEIYQSVGGKGGTEGSFTGG